MSLRLSISDIRKRYGGKEVLKGCTSSFFGGVTAVMGSNGSGKSTLLRICALLEQPASGRVEYFHEKDSPLEHDIGLMRKIALVLPRGGIFDTTVWNNAAYGLKIRGIGRRELNALTAEILEAVGLYEKRRQKARTISTGEAQRLALARAMVLEPDVLFLDEPTVSVDEENTWIIEEIILGMKTPGGPTVVISTHDRAQAERLADTILTIRDGMLHRENVPQSIRI
jgi:tungstate transport system ATP-binding protein